MTRRYLYHVGLILCFLGAWDSWILSFSYLFRLQIPCGASDGCATVASSAAARILGVPLSLFGLGFYISLAIVITRSNWLETAYRSRWPYRLSIAGAVVSTGLTVYSISMLGAECGWCLASNAIAALIAICLAFERPDGFVRPSRRWGFVSGLLTVVTLVAAGIYSDWIYHNAARFSWDPATLSREKPEDLAPPDSILVPAASHRPMVVVYLDLACPACQATFEPVYRAAIASHSGLAVRHFPEKIHRDAPVLALLCVEAERVGKGLDFILWVTRSGASTAKEGKVALSELRCQDTESGRRSARATLRRDRDSAVGLGLTRVPAIFVLLPTGQIRAATLDELQDLLKHGTS
jgi:uncharacterized membrane protein